MTRLTPAEFAARFCAPWSGPHFAPDPPEGSVWQEEGALLAGLAARLGGPVLEIGGDRGISTRYIDSGLALCREHGPGGQRHAVHSVDIAHKWEAHGYPCIHQIHGASGVVQLDGPYVWAFIDGAHDYRSVVRDISVAIDAGAEHLLFHDTTPLHPREVSEARAAVQDYLGPLKDWTLYEVPTKCGLVYACGV